ERDPGEAEDLNSEVRKAFSPVGTRPRRIPEQASLNLEEKVPMLMDSVSEQAERSLADDALQSDVDDSGRREPVFSEPDYDEQQRDKQRQPEPKRSEAFTDEPVDKPKPSQPPRQSEPAPAVAEGAQDDGILSPVRTVRREPRPEPEEAAKQPQEVVVINVMASPGTRFGGAALLQELLANGMRFGAMNIFHRHAEDDGSGEILFSMANMVVPGTFELDEMAEFETPGVSFFLTLPIEGDCVKAFETMVQTTASLCDNLGGELKDENRSVMTAQTIEHCRQRVQEFARRQLSRH
ncbi:MAG: cell division protein ZipA, partial [Cellvibrionaceae bacterium]|nr:cell division protein ZipA [Cellvibrionaceae bacterium]